MMKNTKTNLAANTAKITGTFALACSLLFSACNKQPAADFSLDKSEYSAGDIVKCDNKSIDAKTYKWTFPDGQTSASQNVDYTLDANTSPGTYAIKLQAISKKGSKTSDATKLFTVKAATGQLTLWTTNSLVSQITVKVDNVTVGTITAYYASNPGCGASGCVTANLGIGTHTISATDGTYSWNGTITIVKDKCSTFQFQ
ncbi:MAG: hypothetical protein IT236_09715 [Bacteroidia bacterium]|nr:hypothetical protein [Bacteroidia bacterium]